MWVQQAVIAGLTITGDLIQAQWCEFTKIFKIPEEDQLDLSEGSLTWFDAHNGLVQIRRHGESGSVSPETVSAQCHRLQAIRDLYHP